MGPERLTLTCDRQTAIKSANTAHRPSAMTMTLVYLLCIAPITTPRRKDANSENDE